MRKNIAVMAWNWRALGPKVEEFENQGHRAIGFQISQLGGYGYEDFDEIHVLDYAPEAVEQWGQMAKAAGKEVNAEIFIADKPRDAFETKEPDELPRRKSPRKKAAEKGPEPNGVDVTESE